MGSFDDLPGGEIQYDVPIDFASGEAVEFKLVVDGVEDFIYGIADGAETDRIPLTDQLIADIQGLQIVVLNEPNRRFPKLDDILLVSDIRLQKMCPLAEVSGDRLALLVVDVQQRYFATRQPARQPQELAGQERTER